MQLLRTYADPVVTGATLARPSVGKLPELVGVRGCCTTWMALSGVWATGPQYGNKILAVYDQMLRFAVARRAGGQVGAGALDPVGHSVGRPARVRRKTRRSRPLRSA